MQRNLSTTTHSSAKVSQALQPPQAKTQPIHMKSSADYEQVSAEKMHGYTTRVSVVKKKCNDKLWFRLSRSDSASEVYAARIYRLLIDQYQPKYNQVDYESKSSSASLAQAVSGFIAVGALNDRYKHMVSETELIDAKLGQHQAAAAAVGDGDP